MAIIADAAAEEILQQRTIDPWEAGVDRGLFGLLVVILAWCRVAQDQVRQTIRMGQCVF
jgi:hypothetical protein